MTAANSHLPRNRNWLSLASLLTPLRSVAPSLPAQRPPALIAPLTAEGRDCPEYHRLTLYGQPIVDLQTGRITQYELLLRVLTEEGHVKEPAALLAAAEDSPAMGTLDRWVVRRAIALLSELPDSHARLQVNLSAHALCDSGLLRFISEEFEEHPAAARRLIFEVTETAAVADMDRATSFVKKLKDFGCGFAIDDFGVGFSSFHRLKCLDVDYLKIDRSFITNLPHDTRDQALVRSMVVAAKGLGIATIGEGVEDGATVRALRALDVGYAQGFYLGRPSPFHPFPITGGIAPHLRLSAAG